MATRDPAAAMQLAIFAALSGSPDMAAAFGAAPRVYDQVPLDPSGLIDTALFPYVTIGEDQVVGWTNSCTDNSEVHVKVECWSRSTNKIEVKTIAGAVRAALDVRLDLSAGGFGVVTHKFEQTRILREPDGLTDRAIVTVCFLVSPLFTPPYV